VRTDKPRTARNQNIHRAHHSSLFIM